MQARNRLEMGGVGEHSVVDFKPIKCVRYWREYVLSLCCSWV